MDFMEISSRTDIETFFTGKGIQPLSTDKDLFKIDNVHHIRLIFKKELNRTISNELKKQYRKEGKKQFRKEGKKQYRKEGKKQYRKEGKKQFRKEGKKQYRKEGKKQYRKEGKKQFRKEGKNKPYINHLLIIQEDFELFIFKRLYGHPDTVVYDKNKEYPPTTRQSFLQKIENLEFEEGNENQSIYELFDVHGVVNHFYQNYKRLKEKLGESIEGASDPELLAQIILDRIIFLYFLQVKGILPANFLMNRYKEMARDENFYKDHLHPLFFQMLNKERKRRDPNVVKKFPTIPYLNGGLFTKVEGLEIKTGENIPISIPNAFWDELLTVFNGYEWIIEEKRNDPFAITPSVLGHIYEKSVVQKDTGSYYTPAQITNFITHKSISPYLVKKLNKKFKTDYRRIDQLLDQSDFSEQEIEHISCLYFDILKNLSICDPSCGSGAFLISAEYCLIDIYQKCISILQQNNQPVFQEERKIIETYGSETYFIKRQIITNNIYGVDIQRGCVEITKLRLWLSILSDMDPRANNIEPLPNIDYNIIPGNSLLGYVKLPNTKKIQRILKGKQRKIEEWFGEHKDEKDVAEILLTLQEKKRKYRETKSPKISREIRKFLDENMRGLRGALDQLYCKESEIERRDILKLGDKKNLLGKIKKINSESWIKTFKIHLKKPNPINYEQDIQPHDGIMGYHRRGTVSSIYPTTSFDYEKYNDPGRLSTKIKKVIRGFWKWVDTIELERRISPRELKQLQPFYWGIEFYEIFGKEHDIDKHKNGFDIIVGNPPYIKEDKNKDAFMGLHQKECYQGKTDIWHLFVCRGLKLLKNKGILSYIAKNQWMESKAASNMRKYMYQYSKIKTIIDFGPNKIFRGAGQQTMIFILQKNTSNTTHPIHYLKFVEDLSLWEIEKLLHSPVEGEKLKRIECDIPKHYDEKANLTFSSPDKMPILLKMDQKKNFQFDKRNEIIQGIIGGPDEAFVIKEKQRDTFTKTEQKYVRMYHTHTHRYITPDTDEYIFYLHKDSFSQKELDQCPHITQKLEPFKPQLEDRREVREGNLSWFQLWWARDESFFKEGEKMVFAKRTEGRKFMITEEPFYGSANLFWVKTNRVDLKYITGLLNSRLFHFYMEEKLKHTGDLLQIDKNQFMRIPIYIPEDPAPISNMVDKIINKKKAGKETIKLEKELDQLVYDLYDLTEEEIRTLSS